MDGDQERVRVRRIGRWRGGEMGEGRDDGGDCGRLREGEIGQRENSFVPYLSSTMMIRVNRKATIFVVLQKI